MVFCRIFIEDIMKFKLMVLVLLCVVCHLAANKEGAGNSEDATRVDYNIIVINSTPAKARFMAWQEENKEELENRDGMKVGV